MAPTLVEFRIWELLWHEKGVPSLIFDAGTKTKESHDTALIDVHIGEVEPR